MKKISLCLLLLLLGMSFVVSAEPTVAVDSQTRNVLITDEGDYKRGDLVKLLLLFPDASIDALENGLVTASDAISYVKETAAAKNKVTFAQFQMPLSAPYGNYKGYLISGETVCEFLVPYISAQQLNSVLSDSAKTDDFVWILDNFAQKLPIHTDDITRFAAFDQAGKAYFGKNYILGNGFESMDDATFEATFHTKLDAYVAERNNICVAALNGATTAAEAKKALTDYNDIFGIDFSDTNGIASFGEENKTVLFDRISRLSVTSAVEVPALIQEQTALLKIQLGPWGSVENLLNQYASLLQLDLTVLNRISDKESVYRALVGEEFLLASQLQQKLTELTTSQPINPAPRPLGGGGGGGGGSINIEPPVNSSEKNTEGQVGAAFSDLQTVPWAEAAILNLRDNGVLNGKTATSFCPSDSVTRAEFAKMLVLAFSLSDNGENSGFYDVSSEFWAKKYIDIAWQNGIIQGYEKSFLPHSNITREDMAVMIFRALSKNAENSVTGFSDDKEISDYAKAAVLYLSENKIVSGKGDNLFVPKAYATRAEAAVMVYNAIVK